LSYAAIFFFSECKDSAFFLFCKAKMFFQTQITQILQKCAQKKTYIIMSLTN